ncbi:Hypothetical protein HDN1F_25590 [gamma proteobacterium HdN1]|nr:Hypothetical protein HDN1F_25590 [gamma proteobacterium HdN1]
MPDGLDMATLNVSNSLRRYFTLLYFLLLAMIARFWPEVTVHGSAAKCFLLLATIAYAGLFLSLALAPVGLVALIPKRIHWRDNALIVVSIASGSIVISAVYTDYCLYQLYQYHFNGFVWNLLSTKGGIAALGATSSTERTMMLQAAAIIGGNAGVFWCLQRIPSFTKFHTRNSLPATSHRVARQAWASVFTFVGLLTAAEFAYAYSAWTARESVLTAADAIPFHLHTSAKSLFAKWGIPQSEKRALRLAGGKVVYPDQRVNSSHFHNKNIIILTAESFRWDLLDHEITPNLWELAKQSTQYANHYSGGNRTRMGLFSLFYGLYAPYWFSFERQHVAPVFMDILREHDYQIVAQTSQSFDYPELRNTLFFGVPENSLHEYQCGEPWQRDTESVNAMIQRLDARDTSRPFFGFIFFESTHAPYSFPEDHPLLDDYLHDLNYINLDLKNHIEEIHHRYINAAHHIDEQIGQLLQHLEHTGMLQDTVLLFTGDHGEGFMETGRWGHGHNDFPTEELRVPLILWRPGVTPAVVHHPTSHLQVVPTLLALLGVDQPSRTYSSADPLETSMPYLVFGEYEYMGISDNEHKIIFPYAGNEYFHYSVFNHEEHPVSRIERDTVVANAAPVIADVVRESRRFVQ